MRNKGQKQGGEKREGERERKKREGKKKGKEKRRERKKEGREKRRKRRKKKGRRNGTLIRMSDDNVSKQGRTCTITLWPLIGMSKVLCENDSERPMVEN